MARAMTPAEKQRFRGYFPQLNVDAAVVTGEMCAVYNCISWTVGVTDRWLWPGASLSLFDTFYQGFGFVRSNNGPIAAWGLSATNMTHGSISGPGHGPRWESKCGADLRIQHGLNELVSSSYGHVVAFYDKSRVLADIYSLILKETLTEKSMRNVLTKSQRQLLLKQVDALPRELRRAFEAAFGSWKKTWFSGGLAINSNPSARAIGVEFDALIALGPRILPLVVEALSDADNFIALQLYDALQSDEKLLVQFGSGDDRLVEGEQGRARRVLQAWFTNR